MKVLSNFLVFYLVVLSGNSLVAQDFKYCNAAEFKRIMYRADVYKENNQYVDAKNNYRAARTYSCSSDDVRLAEMKIDSLFALIEDLRQQAETDRANAMQSDSVAKASLKIAQAAKAETKVALEKSKKIIDAFYFYDGKYALAYKNNYFGFIDKEGKKVIEYQYDKAQQFDQSGFAKVSKWDDPIEEDSLVINYLIDTTGKSYQVIYGKPSLINFGYRMLPGFVKRIIKNNNRGSEFSIKMTEDIVALDYREYFLKRFPKSILKHQQLQVLLLDGEERRINEFTTVPTKIKQLKNLEVLSVSHCQLSTLPNEIGGLTRLKKLNLAYNQLSELPLGIAGIDSLEHLDISSNSFDSLPVIVSQLNRLISLKATGNRFKALPNSLGELTTLKYLNLSDNELLQLPLSFEHLTVLEELNLSSNFIQDIPFPIDSLLSLKKLDLRFNLLDGLPIEIGKLHNLEILDLDGQLLQWNLNHNDLVLENIDVNYSMNTNTLLLSIANAFAEFPKKIILCNSNERPSYRNTADLTIYIEQTNGAFYPTDLPPEIGKLKTLTAIELRNTNLSSLPKEIGDLKNLILLDLSENKLGNLPPQIGELKNLEELLLSTNNIDSLPSTIGELKNLAVLDLRNNHLASMPNEIGGLNNLRQLYLSGNPMPPSEFEKLQQLLPECQISF